jgi:hypothetical protein
MRIFSQQIFYDSIKFTQFIDQYFIITAKVCFDNEKKHKIFVIKNFHHLYETNFNEY